MKLSKKKIGSLVKRQLTEGRKYLMAVHPTEDSWQNYPKTFQKKMSRKQTTQLKWDVESRGKRNYTRIGNASLTSQLFCTQSPPL